MSRKEILDYATLKGWKCNIETGEIWSHKGKLINNKKKDGYISCSIYISGKQYSFLSHHFIYYKGYGIIPNIIDHLNGLTCDNRISNLEDGILSENQQNIKNIKGFSYHKSSNKYQARIGIDNKIIYIGVYDTIEQARQEYLEVKRIHHSKKYELFTTKDGK